MDHFSALTIEKTRLDRLSVNCSIIGMLIA